MFSRSWFAGSAAAGTLSCGRYFPNASTTGPRPGHTLTASGDVVSSANNQVIQNLNINGTVRIRHNNVTLTDCIISSGDFFVVECDANAPTGFIMQYCEIDGNDFAANGFDPDGGGGGSIVRFCNIHSTTDKGIGIGEDNMQIYNNYLHDFTVQGGSHTDGIQGAGGFTSLQIHDNAIWGTDTGCITLQNESSGFSGYVVQNNLLVMQSGAACVLVRGDKGPGTVGNGSILNNNCGQDNFPTVPYFDVEFITGTCTVSGNVQYQTCASVS